LLWLADEAGELGLAEGSGLRFVTVLAAVRSNAPLGASAAKGALRVSRQVASFSKILPLAAQSERR
jgi:hypothetical protein